MPPLARLEIQHLSAKVLSLPPEVRQDYSARAFTLGLGITRYFLGLSWIETHLNPENPNATFMRLIASNDPKAHVQSYRTLDLGELLYNLQNIGGFDERIEEMKTGEPEAAYAELHIARMLYVNDWKFRFVPRSGKRGKDYDFEVYRDDGQTVCADAKCKLEGAPFGAKTLENTLSDARDQLPKDYPGVLFVKIPPQWMEQPNFAEITIGAANSFFARGTGRIVSVILYVEPVVYQSGNLIQGHRFKEVINPRHRFDTSKDWRLFTKWTPAPDQWNALPAKWVRLINFDENGRYGVG